MSIAIQKKKFSSKPNSSTISQFIKKTPFHQQYFVVLSDFETNFKKTSCQTTLKNLKNVLEEFYKTIKVDEFLLADLSNNGENTQSDNNENIFLVLKMADLVNLLADYITDKRSILVRNRRSFDFMDRMSSDTRDVTLLCMKILKLLSIINMYFAQLLSNKPRFCIKMFELLLQDNKIYFKQVLGIQEALIAANPDLINHTIYPYMQEALVSMPKKYFARFSRIIALFVLENSEKMDFKELCSDYTDNKMIQVHSFLLSVPDLVETYVTILEYLKEIMERLILSTPQNARKSIRYLKESNLIKDSGLNLSFLKPLFGQAQISGNLATEIFTTKFIVKFIVRKSNLTELLFIISNLLLGKRKIEVQNKLRQISFIDRVVHPLLDLLFHPDLDEEDPFYNDNSPCSNPLITTRIQLLRIIINFCDRDSSNLINKDLLISIEERTVLAHLIKDATKTHSSTPLKQTKGLRFAHMTLEENSDQPTFFTRERLSKNEFDSVQKKGVINKIIALFSRFDPNTNYRFWLASCVESFLRGSNEAHQVLVAHTGLLYTLMEQVLNNKINKSSNVQISFDLVGEIVKFNKYNMIFLEKICEMYKWTDLLAEQATLNVVDSNVFLRALVLSFERFEYVCRVEDNGRQDMESAIDFNRESKIYRRFTRDQKKWLHLIVESVDPVLINQDNICCINTALILTIFAEQRGELEDYLKPLFSSKERSNAETKELLQNFSNVLSIWQRYYMSKTKDSYSLQYTSALPFHYFKYMMQKLQSILEDRIKDL